MNNRVLGLIGVLTSPMLLIQGALSGFDVAAPTRFNAAIGLLFVVGWACCAVGLRRMRATGQGVAATALLVVQLAGLTLAALQQVQDFLYTTETPQTTFYAVCDAAWPLSVMFMLVVGAFALAARVLPGWRRWTPTLCGLAVPLLIGVGATCGRQVGIALFGVYTCIAWALLGVTVWAGASAAALRQLEMLKERERVEL
jgi:hypothetical protein